MLGSRNLILSILGLQGTHAAVLNIVDFGAVAGDMTYNVTNKNSINAALAAAVDGDTVLIPSGEMWHLVGGVLATELSGVTLQIDGDMNFLDDMENWPQVFQLISHTTNTPPKSLCRIQNTTTTTTHAPHHPDDAFLPLIVGARRLPRLLAERH